MNASALALWKDMGKVANVIGEAKRPPASAELVFGVRSRNSCTIALSLLILVNDSALLLSPQASLN